MSSATSHRNQCRSLFQSLSLQNHKGKALDTCHGREMGICSNAKAKMGGIICGLCRASSCDGNFELNRYVPLSDSNDMVKLPWDIVKRGNSMQEKNTFFQR